MAKKKVAKKKIVKQKAPTEIDVLQSRVNALEERLSKLITALQKSRPLKGI